MNNSTNLNGSICDGDRDILRKYLDIAGVIFVVLNRKGEVVSLNHELCKILKMDVSEIRGKNWFDNFVALKDRKWLREIFNDLINNKIKKENKILENSLIDKNGNEKIILWNNSLIDSDDGTVYGTISSGMDITDKVRMEEEQNLIIGILRLLNRSDKKIDLISEILSYIQKHSGFESVGIRLKDNDEYPFFHTLGFSKKSSSNEDYFFIEKNKDEVCNINSECIFNSVMKGIYKKSSHFTEKGTFWTNDMEKISFDKNEILSKDKNTCYKKDYRSLAFIPIYAGNETLGILQLSDSRRGMFKNGDIKFYENIVDSVGIALQRMSIEEEMRNINMKIENTNAKLEQFAYNASHDLREPLRTVTSYVELLEDNMGQNINEIQKECIKKICSGTRLLDKFINDLLSYSRIDTTAVDKENIDLNEICNQIDKNLYSLISKKNGKIIYENLPVIKGNKLLITQLLQNLITNSLKYSGERDSIIHISSQNKGKEWIISIEDNGIGIAEENRESIFEMFKRIKPNEYEGTGMGLAICKKIVETLGGKIWVDSNLGIGSIFYFSIPKMEEQDENISSG